MASSQPIIRQINWIGFLIQLLILFIFSSIYYFFALGDFILLGSITYIVISIILKMTVSRHQRKGMKFVKKKEYKDAISEFIKSYEFFVRNEWVDKYRVITLLSASRIAYREMALVNIAFCYGQLGDGLKSKEFYKKALSEFPDSQIAESANNMLNSVIDNK